MVDIIFADYRVSQKTYRSRYVMENSHIGLMLNDCGRVRYVLGRKIRISPKYDKHLHITLTSMSSSDINFLLQLKHTSAFFRTFFL